MREITTIALFQSSLSLSLFKKSLLTSQNDQRPIGKLLVPVSHAVMFQLAALVFEALTAIGYSHETRHDAAPVADVVAQIGDSDFRRDVDPKRAAVFCVGVEFGNYE